MLVIGAGAQPRLLMPFSADQRRLRELARELNATDAAGRVKEAIDFAHAFLKRGSPDRVVVISDGAFAGAENYAKPAAHLRFVKVDGGEANLAIVGFEVRRPSRSRSVGGNHGAFAKLHRQAGARAADDPVERQSPLP